MLKGLAWIGVRFGLIGVGVGGCGRVVSVEFVSLRLELGWTQQGCWLFFHSGIVFYVVLNVRVGLIEVDVGES